MTVFPVPKGVSVLEQTKRVRQLLTELLAQDAPLDHRDVLSIVHDLHGPEADGPFMLAWYTETRMGIDFIDAGEGMNTGASGGGPIIMVQTYTLHYASSRAS